MDIQQILCILNYSQAAIPTTLILGSGVRFGLSYWGAPWFELQCLLYSRDSLGASDTCVFSVNEWIPDTASNSGHRDDSDRNLFKPRSENNPFVNLERFPQWLVDQVRRHQEGHSFYEREPLYCEDSERKTDKIGRLLLISRDAPDW